MDLVWTIIIQLVLSYVATVTFAIITNVPKRALNACGITGTFGWMAYWTLMQMDSGTGHLPSRSFCGRCAESLFCKT